jgi:RelA/SpoT family (p)ppGpp synthetase
LFHFTDLREQLAQYLSQEQVELIAQAYLLASNAHQGQKRVTGEDYITHPVEVAHILARLRLDHQSIMAALLHDVIEDTSVQKEAIREQFGSKVAELVDGVSKLTQIRFESRAIAQAENFRKMMLAMAQDIRVIIIKLADRLHNMRTLQALAPAKRRRTALETLEIYAPIANRLGMNTFKVEFEDLGFAALYPLRYRVLRESVRRTRGNRRELITRIEKSLQKTLKESGVIEFSLWGREKNLYSLYRKMRKKKLSFSEILDVYAFRIIVADINTCYRVLGIAHNLYKPVLGRFKDYIAIPKSNGYQSLHTTLLGPAGVPLEIQIRDQDMEEIAENGIAAHSLYKETDNYLVEHRHSRTREWLKGLLEIQANTGNSLEFIENVKIDLYTEAVYVFTPQGKILSLPQGATPVDFAYLVHTDVGNHCVACKIDQRLAPLSTLLESGQMVEIITAPGSNPNPAWLSFTVIGKARSNIRHWLKSQQRSESQALGKRLIEATLSQTPWSNLEHLSVVKQQQILNLLQVDSIPDLYEEIGLGKRLAPLVAEHICGSIRESQLLVAPNQPPLVIRGTEGLVVTYAKCCYPIPGDNIMGHFAAGYGILIHVESCTKVQQYIKDPLKSINVHWEKNLQGEFQVPVHVDVINGRGVLGILANVISETNANIVNVNVDERDDRHNTIQFIVAVRDRAHLARIMRRLRAIGMVTKISRGKPG